MGENSKKMQPRAGEAAAEWVSLSSLRPWADNPRHNDGKPVEKVAESIKRFGFASPIIARADGEIIAGHTRYKAAQALGLDRVPVRFLDLDPADAHLLAVADNRLGEFAEWDTPKLQEILSDFSFDDAALAGYTQEDFDEWARDLVPVEVGEDEPPQVPEKPVTRPGDVWVLGGHRVLCGDVTVAEDVDRALLHEKPDICLTDPPYGTGIVAPGGLGRSGVPMDLIGDGDNSLAIAAFRALFQRFSSHVWFGANYYSSALPDRKCWLVWDKDHHGMTFADAELAWTNSDSPVRVFRHAWSGAHRASEKGVERRHPTQKPVALLAWVLTEIVGHGDVFDPFLGSGTTLIAAEQLGRRCCGLEISPAYCDVIVERWENLTGGKAKRE